MKLLSFPCEGFLCVIAIDSFLSCVISLPRPKRLSYTSHSLSSATSQDKESHVAGHVLVCLETSRVPLYLKPSTKLNQHIQPQLLIRTHQLTSNMAGPPASVHQCRCLADISTQVKNNSASLLQFGSQFEGSQAQAQCHDAANWYATQLCSQEKTLLTSKLLEQHTCIKLSYEYAHRVLNTTELLEMILLELPMRDILLSQRVDKNFETTIKHSLKLQRAVFLAPCPDSSLRERRRATSQHTPRGIPARPQIQVLQVGDRRFRDRRHVHGCYR